MAIDKKESNRVITLGKFSREYYKLSGKIPVDDGFINKNFIKNKDLNKAISKNKLQIESLPKEVDSIIFLGYSGDESYGLNDNKKGRSKVFDITGCYMNPINNNFGFGGRSIEVFNIKNFGFNCIHYEFKKLISILSSGDSFLFQSLWLPENKIIYASSMWRKFVENRNLFISRNLYISFYNSSKALFNKLHTNCSYYKCGYNPNIACDLYIKLTILNELLEFNEIKIDRSNIDKKEILYIKNGRMNIAKFKALISSLFKKNKKLMRSSRVPKFVDLKKIESLMIKHSVEWYKINSNFLNQ